MVVPEREASSAVSRVTLPAGIGTPLEVYVNGVPQTRGRDYRLVGGKLVFDRPLAGEGRLGFWRWLSMFLGIAGTYRRDDQVDVIYEHQGRREVATRLKIDVS
jgi:hypothetical protein